MGIKNRSFPETDIYLKEPEHIYLSRKHPQLRLKSATTFIKRFFPPFNAKEKARELAQRTSGKYAPYKTTKEVMDAWDQKAQLGTFVHNALENYVKNGDVNYHSMVLSGIMWLNMVLGYQRYTCYTEQIIGVPQLHLAGTIDLLVYDKKTNSYIIADWKTNESIYKFGFNGSKGNHWATVIKPDCNFTHYSLQLSLYAWILRKFYNMNVRGLYLIHLRPSNTPKYPLGFQQYTVEYDPYTINNMITAQLQWIKEGDVFTSKEIDSWENLDYLK